MRRSALRIQTVGFLLVLALIGSLATPVMALAETPDVTDEFPGDLWELPIDVPDGHLDLAAGDVRDVYKVWLENGQEFDAELLGAVGTDFDLYLFDPTDAEDPDVAHSATDGSSEAIHYGVKTSGWYYLDVKAYDGSNSDSPNPSGPGGYTLSAFQHGVSYELDKFTAPKTAKKNKKVTVSVLLHPGYLGQGTVTIHTRQWSRGKWAGKAKTASLVGGDVEGATKYEAEWSANKGTWRVWWTFSGPASLKTAYKTITIR